MNIIIYCVILLGQSCTHCSVAKLLAIDLILDDYAASEKKCKVIQNHQHKEKSKKGDTVDEVDGADLGKFEIIRRELLNATANQTSPSEYDLEVTNAPGQGVYQYK